MGEVIYPDFSRRRTTEQTVNSGKLSLKDAKMILGKLPSVFEKYSFYPDGIVLTDKGPKVAVYVASGEGFNFTGRYFLDNYLHPRIESIGGFVLDPFKLCAEFRDPRIENQNISVSAKKTMEERFGTVVIPTVNYGLSIPRSGLLFAILDGYPVDEGGSSEIAFMATNFGPVVVARSDFRLAESLASGTNWAVRHFATEKYSGGSYHEDPNTDLAYLKALRATKQIIDRKLEKWFADTAKWQM